MNKTENTLENKAKFFAQYWGQKLMFWTENYDQTLSKIGMTQMNKYSITKRTLHLTPLSQITDEDAIFIINNHTRPLTNYVTKLSSKRCLTDQPYISYEVENNIVRHFILKHENLYPHNYDYLRSKGYALPWMGLSVEDLVSYGWLKLKS